MVNLALLKFNKGHNYSLLNLCRKKYLNFFYFGEDL